MWNKVYGQLLFAEHAQETIVAFFVAWVSCLWDRFHGRDARATFQMRQLCFLRVPSERVHDSFFRSAKDDSSRFRVPKHFLPTNRPIRAGLNARFRFGCRFGLCSGCFRSRFRKGFFRRFGRKTDPQYEHAHKSKTATG